MQTTLQALFRSTTTGVVVQGFRSSSVPVTHKGYLVESRRPLWFGFSRANHSVFNTLSRHSPLAAVSRSTSIMHLSMPSPTPPPPVRSRWGWGGDLIPYHFNFSHVGQARDVKSPIFSHQETIYIAHEAKKNCTWKSRPIKSPTPGRKQCINYPTLPHLLPVLGGVGLDIDSRIISLRGKSSGIVWSNCRTV